VAIAPTDETNMYWCAITCHRNKQTPSFLLALGQHNIQQKGDVLREEGYKLEVAVLPFPDPLVLSHGNFFLVSCFMPWKQATICGTDQGRLRDTKNVAGQHAQAVYIRALFPSILNIGLLFRDRLANKVGEDLIKVLSRDDDETWQLGPLCFQIATR